MGSSKETTGFPEGTHRFPTGFTLIPGIKQNEKDKAMGVELKREIRKTRRVFKKHGAFLSGDYLVVQ